MVKTTKYVISLVAKGLKNLEMLGQCKGKAPLGALDI